MKRLSVLILILILLLSASALVHAQSAAINNTSPVRTLTVQGSSHLETVPDEAFITIAVITNGSSANAAAAENARITAAVQDKVMFLNIDKNNIRTTQYMVSPVYNNDAGKTDGAPAIIGYKATNAIQVKVDDMTSIGKLIDSALSAGANQVTNIRFSKKEEADLKQQALKAAIRDASQKASAISSALGTHLGKPIAVTEDNISLQNPGDSLMFKSLAAAPATPVMPGELQINASVTVVYEIE
ncbi:Hypothetical protein LUCI_4021 [Lucifera butyrica]|uniref:26 kDa periplasmic immunogenic protein n=1 Tax=Lucifera butyrica TaxID=1351585 RepID=A0A498RF75_9FIRM|nr:SIMPL domain-containing protein [Lucifera butyrica]VBB08743.1 Hypothetical protein LUCI_4021 [Lucifera butyrica]